MLAYAGVCWRMLAYADVWLGMAGEAGWLKTVGYIRGHMTRLGWSVEEDSFTGPKLLALLVQKYKY